ncbi:MAG TPA: DUF4159 domain-containing protein [Gammaproteobacteria bacterium]
MFRTPTNAAGFGAFFLAVSAFLVAAIAAEPGDGDPEAEFHFARMAFGVAGGAAGWSRREPWLRDWPDAEVHFVEGISRLTRVDTGRDNRQVRLSDDTLFNYPLLYAVKVGFWNLSDYEAARLREYLLRGGFLIVDDFHGPTEWVTFAASLKRVFPDRPIVEIPVESEVFNVLYSLDQLVQIPGAQAIRYGVTWEHPQGRTPHWRGVYDDAGRLLVAINFNMDLGDAWEHADDAFYPEPLTALAYRFGVNYVIYSMTH